MCHLESIQIITGSSKTIEEGRSIWEVFSALLEIDKQAMGKRQKDYVEAARRHSKKALRHGF
jgi:hypothetical protein